MGVGGVGRRIRARNGSTNENETITRLSSFVEGESFGGSFDGSYDKIFGAHLEDQPGRAA